MDGNEIDYSESFEKLAKMKGEIVALVTSSHDDRYALTERDLLKGYEKAKAHNAAVPDDLKMKSAHFMAIDQQARAAIQDYKIRRGIPLDTPPVDLNAPKNFHNAANDPVYGAEIDTLDL